MATYGLQKALKWFEKNNGNIKIETDTMQLKFSLNPEISFSNKCLEANAR